jgi:hypothetical protein
MIRDFFYTPPFTMIAAAPAADQEQTIQKNPSPPDLREAMRRGSIGYITIFMVRE